MTPEAPHWTLPDWPVFGLDEDVRPALAEAVQRGLPLVLATLTAVGGGGPRPPGAQMVFADGILAGYFSGGCVEGDVAGHAATCLADGKPHTLVYGEGSPWPDIRLLCGARIEIVLERLAPDDPMLLAVLAAWRARAPYEYMSPRVRKLYEPTPRLVIIGGDPTALAIAELGVKSGFETTLVRPKGPETPPPVAGVAYRREAPAVALAALGVDAWTSIAIATHDIDTDREALVAALPSAAGYVGLLGARRRLEGRIAELEALGVPAAARARLRAPIGLDIGGKAPFEVAVSVIGEITALRYARASVMISTTSPAAAAAAPDGRRTSASAEAKTLTSEES